MRKSLILACVLGATALIVPIAASLYWASREARNEEQAYAQSVATELLRRSTIARLQLYEAFTTLQRLGPSSCSEAAIATMRRLSMSLNYLKDAGVIRDGKLVCSAFGNYPQGVDIGSTGGPGPQGVQVHQNIALPYAPDLRLHLYERAGWMVVLHPDYVTDIVLRDRDMSVAVLISAPLVVGQTRGPFDLDWLRHYRTHESSVVELPDHLLVIQASRDANLAAMVALPRARQNERTRKLALMLLPLGAVAGLLMIAAGMLAARQRLSLRNDIRLALKRREFHVRYQPIVDLQTGRCIGAEALLRWLRPGKLQISPDLFIPVAEQSGLINAITHYVIDITLRDLSVLLAEQPEFHLGINFSALDLQAGGPVKHLTEQVRKLNYPESSVVVELTERNVTDTKAACLQISRLHEHGVHVAVDDFGTGHSSLSLLAGLELDVLKIDRSFVEAIDAQAAASQVLPHIIDMAKTLQLFIVAEGVETETQADYLRERGVHMAQGWLYGKPMPIEDLLSLLRAQGKATEPGAQEVQEAHA